MSTEALSAGAGIPPGELAIAQRVQQLQALIERAGQASISPTATTLATSGSSSAPAMDFATALQAATTADSIPPGGQDMSAAGAVAGSGEYDAMVEQAAARNGVDPAVLHGLIQQESGFDPNSQSSAGAAGLTQLMPGTASSLGVANPLDPAESIEGGARYLSQMMAQFGGNTADALAAYNAGPGAVHQYGGVPPYAETQSYVSKVLGYAEAYRQNHPVPSAPGSFA